MSYYPSITIDLVTTETIRDFNLKSGQWVHDLISKGRLLIKGKKFFIIWKEPYESFLSFMSRCRDFFSGLIPWLPLPRKAHPLSKKNNGQTQQDRQQTLQLEEPNPCSYPDIDGDSYVYDDFD